MNTPRTSATTSALRLSFSVLAMLALCTSISVAQSDKSGSDAPIIVPASAVSQSDMDLRTAPRQVHETADAIFVVRNDCGAEIRIDQYAKSTLTNQPFTVTNCRRFHGNVISAIASDARHIYIKFGIDEEEGPSFSKETAPNLLVLDRATYKEVATSHSKFWIDRLDAFGSELVGCNCIGTFQLMPTQTCAIAKKFPSKVLFSESDIPAGVACLGGSTAVAAARIFTGENGRWVGGGVAVNERYIVEPFSNAPTAVYTVAAPTRKLDITLPPPGYEVAALGTGPTADSAVLIRKNGGSIAVAIEHIPDGKVTELTELPAPNESPSIHLYATWLVAANADTVFIKEMAPPNRSFLFKTANNSWIRAAEIYGHLLYVRSVPFGGNTGQELPALQIDLDVLRR